MSDTLRAALEEVRAHLEPGIAEAQLELADARARCAELRRLASIVRPVVPAPSAAHPVPTSPEVAPELAPPHVGPATTSASPVTALAVSDRHRADTPTLPLRWVLALGALGRLDLERLPRLLARNIILRWEGDNPLSGTHLGHAKALDFIRHLEPFLSPASVRVHDVHSDGSSVEIAVAVTLRAPSRADVQVDTDLTVVARFDPAGMIALLFATPADPAAVDAFFNVAMTEDSRSA
jgi:ketosteroid isomerase-like protein